MNKSTEMVRRYTSESQVRKPGNLIRGMFSDAISGRELAWRLAVRDINSHYRQSLLGILWAFIIPLATTLTWLFLRRSGVISMGETSIPYPIYVFTGAMLWTIFTESLQAPLQKTQSNKGMIAKINFPREALILSGIYQTLFNSVIKVLLMVVGMYLLGHRAIGWQMLLFPGAVFALILTGTAIGLFLTPLGLLYHDVGRGLNIALQFLMYATPVVFPIPTEGWIADIFLLNPVTPLIVASRDWLTSNPTAFLDPFLFVTGISALLFFISLLLYRIAMPFLVERMSS